MIISEKQIFYLIRIAESYRETLHQIIERGLGKADAQKFDNDIDNLLSAIANQQSEELKSNEN